MKTLKEHKEVLEGVLCMDAWGVFILGAALSLIGVRLENIQLMGWGIGITLAIGLVMGFYMTKHLEKKRCFIVQRTALSGK